jgi:Sugar phosphate permease
MSGTQNSYFDGYPVSKKQSIMFFLIVFGTFFDHLDNGNFAIVAPALIKFWHLTLTDIGFISSMYFIGTFIGGIAGGVLADRFGRKAAFLGSVFFFSAFSLLNAFALNVNMYAICRACTGIGIASLTVVSLSYIAEISPGKTRGRWMGLVGVFCYALVPFVMALFKYIIPLSPTGWKWVLFIGALGFIPGIIGILVLRESPRWLVSKGRYKEAEKIMLELIPDIKEIDLSQERQQPKIKISAQLGEIFGKKYIKYSVLLMFAAILYWPASFSIVTFAPSLLIKRGFSIEASLNLALLGSIAAPLGCILSSLVSDRGGRKIPLVTAFIGSGILVVLYGFIKDLNLLYVTYMVFYALVIFLGNLMFSYIPENFSSRVRSTASGIIWSASRPVTAGMQILAPIIIAVYGTVTLFEILGGMFLLGGALVAIFGRRTAGISLEKLHGEESSSDISNNELDSKLAKA